VTDHAAGGREVAGEEAGMLSEQAQAEWAAFMEATGEAAIDRDMLNRFLIGLHRRGESLYAHDLKTLLDEASLPPDARDEVMAFVEPALSLLAAYDRVQSEEDEWYVDAAELDDFGPGDLIL
jgi:hypothetical protein